MNLINERHAKDLMRKLTLILITIFVIALSAYTRGYYHFCGCHTQEFSISHEDTDQCFILAEHSLSDADFRSASSFIVLSQEISPDVPPCLKSVNDRAPPLYNVQAVAPCHRDMRVVGV